MPTWIENEASSHVQFRGNLSSSWRVDFSRSALVPENAQPLTVVDLREMWTSFFS